MNAFVDHHIKVTVVNVRWTNVINVISTPNVLKLMSLNVVCAKKVGLATDTNAARTQVNCFKKLIVFFNKYPNKKGNCNCDENAQCIPNLSTNKQECRCKPGFIGDGFK